MKTLIISSKIPIERIWPLSTSIYLVSTITKTAYIPFSSPTSCPVYIDRLEAYRAAINKVEKFEIIRRGIFGGINL